MRSPWRRDLVISGDLSPLKQQRPPDPLAAGSVGAREPIRRQGVHRLGRYLKVLVSDNTIDAILLDSV